MSRKAYVRPADAVNCDRVVTRTFSETRRAFNIRDDRARVVGACITRYQITYTPNGQNYGYTHTPGVFEAVDVHATRDGLTFGASQPSHLFATSAEADAKGESLVAAMEKRYAKKFNSNA